jgi:protoporphyrinogen/coproporphyrinogen III oxidase
VLSNPYRFLGRTAPGGRAGQGGDVPERTSVAIVGGGITGLALAHELRRFGVAHLVMEAAQRPGGVIRSARVDGHLLEWGPQRTRLTAGLRELVAEVGIADEVITAPAGLPLYVFRAGRLRRVPFSVGSYLRSDIVPHLSKLRPLFEPFTAAARPQESVARDFPRKLGKSLYENLAGPLYGGLYASDPADMVVGLSLGHVLAEFGIRRSLLWRFLRSGGSVDPPAACSFREGMEVLPAALHRANASEVRLGVRVEAIRPVGREWEIEWRGGAVRAESVVVTVPAPVAAKLLAPVSGAAADALRRLRYNPLAVVHLLADTELRGLGYQVSLAERMLTRGVTFNDSLFGRIGVYTAYLGGAKAPGVVDWTDEAIGAAAVREFRAATGFDARVLSVEREAMPAWDASWSALAEFSLPPGIHLAANWESRPGIPGRLAQAKRVAGQLA